MTGRAEAIERAQEIATKAAKQYLFRGDDGALIHHGDGSKLAAWVAGREKPEKLLNVAKAGNATAYRALQWLAAVYANDMPGEPMPLAVRVFLAWSIVNPLPAKAGPAARKLDRNHDAAAVAFTVEKIQNETGLPRFGQQNAGNDDASATAITAEAFGLTGAAVRKLLEASRKSSSKEN
jgi:hypothetical protein